MDDFLAVAATLVKAGATNGNPAYFRRAVSSAYDALFHAVAASAADLLIGVLPEDLDAWQRVYRALDHGPAKAACLAIKIPQSSPQLADCAAAFIALQEARHGADHDPLHPIDETEATYAIEAARHAIDQLTSATATERKRFAVSLLFPQR